VEVVVVLVSPEGAAVVVVVASPAGLAVVVVASVVAPVVSAAGVVTSVVVVSVLLESPDLQPVKVTVVATAKPSKVRVNNLDVMDNSLINKCSTTDEKKQVKTG
jgi:hypothetical protein